MALSKKGVKTAKDMIKKDKFIEKFRDDPSRFLKPKKPKRNPLTPDELFPKRKPKMERMPLPADPNLPGSRPKKKRKKPAPRKKKRLTKNLFADGGKAESFGMLSVKAGVDNNPNPTQADRIVGATKKKNGGPVDSPKKGKKKKMPGMLAIGIEIIKPKKPIKAARGGLAGRLAKRGYGKARS